MHTHISSTQSMKIKQDIGAQIKKYLSRLNHDVTGAEILLSHPKLVRSLL